MVTVRKSTDPELNTVDIKNKDYELDSINDSSTDLIVLYIYRLPKFQAHGFKVGMVKCKPKETFWHAIKERIRIQKNELALTDEQYSKYGNEREVVYWGVCLDAFNESFKDYYVHNKIKDEYSGLVKQEQEWFINIALDNLIDVFNKCRLEGENREIYTPRKEQRECIDKLSEYFHQYETGERFLLNCKMRFGKCYTVYKYCEENDINKILILTFVPAVEESWQEDLYHIEKEYDYFTDETLKQPEFDLTKQTKPYVIFLSLQNYLGKDSNSNDVKNKIKKLEKVDFDLLVLDEYHFGAWNKRTQETLEDFDPVYLKTIKNESDSDIIKKFGVRIKKTVCLSGTPFKALARGDFTDKNTFTYSYFDEQMNKYPNSRNSDSYDKFEMDQDYAQFPDMKIFGYNMSHLFESLEIQSHNSLLNKSFFSLNKFFECTKDNNSSLDNKFVYEDKVKQWLQIISGKSYRGEQFPYSNPDMLNQNKHTLWLMPTVNACEAMANLLSEDDYFKRYEIVNLSAPDFGVGKKALDGLNREIIKSENTNKLGTIAITVNKLTLGVTVKPWMAVFVLKDLESPESYFQSIFRIQTPYVKSDGTIIKKYGYVYDFNIDRAAALMLNFATEASKKTNATRMEIAKLIVKYMPIYQNGNMQKPIDYDVFYNLAMYGDTQGKSLSSRIKNLSVTTRAADPDIISEMLNDPDVSDIIKRVFAHTKFNQPKTKTYPDIPPKGFKTKEFLEGHQCGYQNGRNDYKKFLDLDDTKIQQEFDDTVDNYLKQYKNENFTLEEQNNFNNGFRQGYDSGINAPIKKLQCGREDGFKFAKELKAENGENFFYNKENKAAINDAVAKYLNDSKNIPAEYSSGMLYKRWYKESFAAAVKNYLRPPRASNDGITVEDAANVISHILSRLFQFLYISVYRETTFNEIFQNAAPEIFLEAVGIKKKEFEAFNKYKIFQEDVLDNYIKEFFVNETFGEAHNDNDFVKENYRKNYRNSFEWFGFHELPDNYEAEKENNAEVAEEKTSSQNELKLFKNELSTETTQVESAEEKPEEIKRLDKNDIPSILNKKIDIRIYTAIYYIDALNKMIHCDSNIENIKNYLCGNSSTIFYSYFNKEPSYGSFRFISTRVLQKSLNKMIAAGVIEKTKDRTAVYHIKNSKNTQ